MIELTPDEIATAVLARQRWSRWPGAITALSWLLWLAAAGWTAYFLADYASLVLTERDFTVFPVLKVPGRWEGEPPAADAPKVPGGEVTLVYGSPRTTPAQPVRPPTAAESLKAAVYRADRLSGRLSYAVFQLAWIVGLVVLALFTTLLSVLAGRRATLRQIQASLAAIAGQLADVQRGRGTMPPTAGG